MKQIEIAQTKGRRQKGQGLIVVQKVAPNVISERQINDEEHEAEMEKDRSRRDTDAENPDVHKKFLMQTSRKDWHIYKATGSYDDLFQSLNKPADKQ